jgi:hypothetical protein
MTKLEAVNFILAEIGVSGVAALDTGGYTQQAKAETRIDRANREVQQRGWQENTEKEVELNFASVQLTVAITAADSFEVGEIITQDTSGATGYCTEDLDDTATTMNICPISGTFDDTNDISGEDGGAATVSALTNPTSGVIVFPRNVLSVDFSATGETLAVRGRLIFNLDGNTFEFTDSLLNLILIVLLDFEDLMAELQTVVVMEAAKAFQRKETGDRVKDAFIRDELDKAERDANRIEVTNVNANVLNSPFARKILGKSGGTMSSR